MNLSAIQLSQLLAVEQVQHSLEYAALVLSDGKSASIKSISECIQVRITKNKRHFESDEPDAPLLLERELTVEEVDVVIGGKQSDQANDSANKGFQQAFILAGAGAAASSRSISKSSCSTAFSETTSPSRVDSWAFTPDTSSTQPIHQSPSCFTTAV
jgi:hypothetical protein